jgi:hypothetical protein
MHLFFLVIVLNYSASVFAEISTPSIFPSNKSINPALINWRENGIIRLKLASEYMTKKQYVKTYKSASFISDQYDDIKIADSTFFVAGKGGGGLTTEMKLGYTKGQKDTSIIDGNKKHIDFKTINDSAYGSFGFGSEGWGTELHFLNYKCHYNLSDTINGQQINSHDDVKMVVFGIKQGYVFGSPTFGVGLTMQFDRLRPKGAIKDFTSQLYNLGLGIGGGNDFRFELNAQVDPVTNIAPHIPIKVSFILEYRFEKALLGYSANWYAGRYVDLENLVQTKMYNNFNGDSALVHNVDISFGRARGFDWGWIFIYTESSSKTKSTIYETNEKHHTNNRNFSFALKFGKTY